MKIYDTLTIKMRPTQICVGFSEVIDKKIKLGKLNKHQLLKYLKENPLPAVAGPDGRMYLTDHHHLGRALIEMGIDRSFFIVQHDFSDIPEHKFFDVLKVLELVHPFDENGKERTYKEIPKLLTQLKDDPYRSLAGFVRRAGGYTKVDKAYLEFQWADHFRPLIPKEMLMTKKGIRQAVNMALKIAKSAQSEHMLGWVGETIKVKPSIKNKIISKEKTIEKIKARTNTEKTLTKSFK